MSLVNEKIEKRELKMAKERIKIIAKECRLLEKSSNFAVRNKTE